MLRAYQLPEEQHAPGPWERCVSCLGFVLRLCCCLNNEADLSLGEATPHTNLLEARDRRSHQQESAIEAALTPPRAPELEHRSPIKGAPPSPPVPQWLPLHQPQRRRAGGGSGAAGAAGGRGNSPAPELEASGSASPKGMGEKEDQLSLLEDDDVCPVCLEPYTDDNPKLSTACGHHYHLQCALSWLERGGQACPMCGGEMGLADMLG